jgi:DNA-binding transcriptional ArsR family regulator
VVAPPIDDVVELTDAKAIRAIAHPARLIVIDALYDQGLELTATQAAQLAGTSPSAMSYHLRALERYGMVRRADPTGDARERPWVRAAKDIRVKPPPPTSTRAVALATGAVLSTAIDVTRQRLVSALERGQTEHRHPLDKVARFGTTTVLVTADEAESLFEQINELLEPLRIENRSTAAEGSAKLMVVVAAAPETEPNGHDGRRRRRS